jgi:hypothetical protein
VSALTLAAGSPASAFSSAFLLAPSSLQLFVQAFAFTTPLSFNEQL